MEFIGRSDANLSLSEDVLNVCSNFLERYRLNFFRYMKLFKDGKRINLCTNIGWTRHFYENSYYKIAWFDNKKFDFYENQKIIWDEKAIKEDNVVGIDAREIFGIHHGFTIVKKNKDNCEFYDFATIKNNHEINLFYKSGINEIELFILDFKKKSL
ncbi:MAG: hypothetical protein ACKOAD_06165, partial [Gammaproteobacteria bacterium]